LFHACYNLVLISDEHYACPLKDPVETAVGSLILSVVLAAD
jgi:hypothetical protein